MTRKERIGISEYKTATAPNSLVTYGLGSCLGIILYDSEKKYGGMAHTLLPEPRPGMDVERKTKFVTTSIRLMLDELLDMGCAQDNLTAKLFGGANMFSGLQSADKETIGQRNIRVAHETLEQLNIPLVAEDTGGNFGRTLVFDLDSGQVMVRSVREEKQEQYF
jgi:chemotaxis protein CheD